MPDLVIVNLGTRAADDQGCTWDMQMIDGCSIELCVATEINLILLGDFFVMAPLESISLHYMIYL